MLFHLLSGTLRFNEIRRHIANVTPRMLTNQLRELEEDGLIARKVYAQVPAEGGIQPVAARPQHGAPILLALKDWGDANIDLYGKPHTRQNACAA